MAWRSCSPWHQLRCQLFEVIQETYCVGDTVSEFDELDSVFSLSPFRAQSEYEVQGRVVRVGRVVVQREMPDRVEGGRF